jgi:aminopeptidase N
VEYGGSATSVRSRRKATDDLWAYPPGNPGSGENIFGTPVYARGAMVLHELRLAVGDKTFFSILRAWAGAHRYGHGTTAQFVSLAEQKSGTRLDALFHTWLYTKGKPTQP